MRSMKGITIFNPGASVAWYFPSLSTTHACCCGTTLMVLKTNTTARTKRTKGTVPKFNSIANLPSLMMSGVGHDQPASPDLANDEGARLRLCSLRQFGIPHCAAIHDTRHGLTVLVCRFPVLDMKRLPDIEIDVRIVRGVGFGSLAQAAVAQRIGGDHADHGRADHLGRPLDAGYRQDGACSQAQGEHQQIKSAAEQL